MHPCLKPSEMLSGSQCVYIAMDAKLAGQQLLRIAHPPRLSPLQLLERMQQHGFTPSFNATVRAAARYGNLRAALTLLGSMKEHGIKLHIATCRCLLHALNDARQWKRALRLLDEMQLQGLQADVESYELIATACETSGQLVLANKTLDKAQLHLDLDIAPPMRWWLDATG
eukprot:CAMPEP_0197685074 /NCGR_PEP_ID=MMETSP1338-20131121/100401_1 /TAXON_ID=43686 ORGANISM="Pelagodinium beii, Strain RCC1491" /NCGR_SAMPLE_ID=MMETSP1338 /ASSEMBLY_ACC=CAM_ASM_000754 /LENGTH=170 /DNA_ID=CAMNT_0043266859 /DNA_START=36 /DNA_END=548 /DNA_ORIENTATION=-